MAEKVFVTDAQVKAAQMIVDRDKALGRQTDEAIRRIANAVPQARLGTVARDTGQSGDQGVVRESSRAARSDDPSHAPRFLRSQQIDSLTDALVGDWLSLPEVTSRLNIPARRIKQLLRDRRLLAVRRPNGSLSVPAAFLDGNQILKGLGGTLTVLFDCGFDEHEALRWLFTADESLPGTPVEALTNRRGAEVTRRVQELRL